MNLEAIRAVAERVCHSEGLDVVEVEWKTGRQRFLRIYIDREGGVTHGDCERVSEQVGIILDVEELVPSNYILEVSSPGLDRKLLKQSDYERFQGKLASLTIRSPIGSRRHFRGRIAGFANDIVSLDTDQGRVEVPFAEITKAHLVVEF
jgi:ribosome maturation factor RimP